MNKKSKHTTETLTDEEFEKRFNAGEDLERLGFDLNAGYIDKPEVKRVNVDFPSDILKQLDRVADRIGITRQSLIKVWLVERLDQEMSLVK
jgi:hypothetical protein